MVRDPYTGALLADRPQTKRDWRHDLDGATYDLDLLPTHGTIKYLQDLAQRAARDGVTVTADIQQMMTRPVDRQPYGMIAIMPRDEREQRDGKPLAIFDNRPGRVPMMLITNRHRHLGEAVDMVHRARADKHDVVVPWERQPDPNYDFQKWTSQAQDHRVGRKRFAFTKVGGMTRSAEEWFDHATERKSRS